MVAEQGCQAPRHGSEIDVRHPTEILKPRACDLCEHHHLTRPFFTVLRTNSHAQHWLKFESALISCVIPSSWFMRIVCLSDCLDISIHFFFLISVSLITVFFLLPDNFIFHDVVDKSPVHLGTVAENEPPTGCEPNEYHITEAYVEYTQDSTGEQRSPSDFDNDDVTIGKTLLDACRRRADHSEAEGLSSCLSLSVSHGRTVRPVVCSFDSQVSSVQETQRHNSESEQIRILLERQREQILADCQAEIRKHEFQADYDRGSIQKLNEMTESQKEEICRAHQGDERRRQDHQLLHEQLLKQNWDLREAHEKSLNEMKELKRFQGSTFDTIARRKLVEDRDTILELTGKIQELQNEINFMNDSRDFQDAESVRSGHSHVASQPVSFPPHPVPGGMQSVLWEC